MKVKQPSRLCPALTCHGSPGRRNAAVLRCPLPSPSDTQLIGGGASARGRPPKDSMELLLPQATADLGLAGGPGCPGSGACAGPEVSAGLSSCSRQGARGGGGGGGGRACTPPPPPGAIAGPPGLTAPLPAVAHRWRGRCSASMGSAARTAGCETRHTGWRRRWLPRCAAAASAAAAAAAWAHCASASRCTAPCTTHARPHPHRTALT